MHQWSGTCIATVITKASVCYYLIKDSVFAVGHTHFLYGSCILLSYYETCDVRKQSAEESTLDSFPLTACKLTEWLYTEVPILLMYTIRISFLPKLISACLTINDVNFITSKFCCCSFLNCTNFPAFLSVPSVYRSVDCVALNSRKPCVQYCHQRTLDHSASK